MRPRLSFRALIILLLVGCMIPLLAAVGLVVYRLQQTYLIHEAERRLMSFVQTGVEQHAANADLTVLAVSLGEHMRVLGADLFVQDAVGTPVAPSLGTGPWLDAAEHRRVRDSRESRLETIGTGATSRIVYLASVVDPTGAVIGSVEASLPMDAILDQLGALRRWLVLIIALASGLSVILAVPLSAVVTRPLARVVDSVERARTGDLETRAPVPGVYELGRLAETYNQMLDRISADYAKQTQLAESMRQFAADASHELRSPLSVFRNSVDVMDSAYQQNDQPQFPGILAMLRREVDTMTGLVENLLLLARLDQPEEAAASQLHREEIHPVPLVEEVYERSLLLAQGQIVEMRWPANNITPILADREMVRRALNNVVENALAYTQAGKKVVLSVESRGDRVSFAIEDQGQGMTSEQLSRAFERFYRGDESRNRKLPGTGLGLAIVAAIVRVHKGSIEVESQPGQGTRIRLLFKSVRAST